MKAFAIPPLIQRTVLVGLLAQAGLASAQSLDAARLQDLDQRIAALQPKMVAWRRDIYQHPELSGQEVGTEMLGTLRTFDNDMRADAKKRLGATAESIAAASGAKAEVSFTSVAFAPLSNPAALSEAPVPVLRSIAGDKLVQSPKVSASEDFSDFQAVAPGFFFILGATPKGKTPATAPPNHSPAFDFDEDAMAVGAKALDALALDSLARKQSLQTQPDQRNRP